MKSFDLHEQFHTILTASKLRVVGHQDIYDLAEISLMIAVLQAYGQSKTGFLYAEPALLDARIAPPDLVLAHPETGLVVFECKAYDLEFIYGTEAGNLKIVRYGREELVNPLRQAQRAMFAIKDALDRFAYNGSRPLFHAVVALPNIRENEWKRLGYDRCIDGRVVLFQDHIQNPEKLRQLLAALITSTQQRVGNVNPYPPTSEPMLLRVFGDSAVINNARQTVRDLDPNSIGAQIDAMEHAHKQLSAEQQYLSRMDTWGYPYLVRGVAGSGKSVVLANQVARTLYRHEKEQNQLALFEDIAKTMPRIGVVCFNRSLVPLLRDRILRAYQNLGGESLPDTLIVTDLNRILYEIPQALGDDSFRYIPVSKARNASERARKHLEQLEQLRTQKPKLFELLCFDGLVIDEGQDAHPDEYAILRTLVRPNSQTGERGITIFYDDAQNLYGNPPPTWRNLSLNMAGGRSTFMQICHRNSREILELGMNVLLGTHAPQRMKVASRKFVDIYTLQEKNLVEETKQGWRVHFAQSSGVEPIVRGFTSRLEQLDWVAEAIIATLEAEKVLPEYLLVLAPRSTSFQYLGQRIAQLATKPLPLRLVGGSYQQHLDDLLIIPNHLTLATIHASKGYDAPFVFLLDVDQIENTVLGRALFYVGATRAKRYLMVTGVDLPNTLMREVK